MRSGRIPSLEISFVSPLPSFPIRITSRFHNQFIALRSTPLCSLARFIGQIPVQMHCLCLSIPSFIHPVSIASEIVLPSDWDIHLQCPIKPQNCSLAGFQSKLPLSLHILPLSRFGPDHPGRSTSLSRRVIDRESSRFRGGGQDREIAREREHLSLIFQFHLFLILSCCFR